MSPCLSPWVFTPLTQLVEAAAWHQFLSALSAWTWVFSCVWQHPAFTVGCFSVSGSYNHSIYLCSLQAPVWIILLNSWAKLFQVFYSCVLSGFLFWCKTSSSWCNFLTSDSCTACSSAWSYFSHLVMSLILFHFVCLGFSPYYAPSSFLKFLFTLSCWSTPNFPPPFNSRFICNSQLYSALLLVIFHTWRKGCGLTSTVCRTIPLMEEKAL